MTGSVKFSENGRRSEFVANIFQLSARGLTKISTWSPETGIQIDKDTAVAEGGLLELSLKNMTFIVLTSLVPRPQNFQNIVKIFMTFVLITDRAIWNV